MIWEGITLSARLKGLVLLPRSADASDPGPFLP